MQEVTHNEEMGGRILQQFMDLFVLPAIAERQAAHDLPKPLNLRAAQIIFLPDGRKPFVRINDEVQAIAEVRFKKGISKTARLPIHDSDVEGLGKIGLTDDDNPDCGHATLIKLGHTWVVAFDFRYNKRMSKQHVDAAQEFYDTAQAALGEGRELVFIDNLFSAGELAAKAILLGTPDAKFTRRATHKAIHSRFNRFASLGNASKTHLLAFNRLYALRDRARYLKGKPNLKPGEARSLLSAVGEMIDSARNWSSP